MVDTEKCFKQKLFGEGHKKILWWLIWSWVDRQT